MPPDPLITFLVESQKEQTSVLRQLSGSMARVETTLESRGDADQLQDDRIVELAKRVESLEHDRVAARTALAITWGVMVLLGSVVAWAYPR